MLSYPGLLLLLSIFVVHGQSDKVTPAAVITTTCNPEDPPILCDEDIQEGTTTIRTTTNNQGNCDQSSIYENCDVICESYLGSCLATSFLNSFVECQGLLVCGNANFAQSEIHCTSFGSTSIQEDDEEEEDNQRPCQGSTFSNSKVYCEDDTQHACVATTAYHSMVECWGDYSCYESEFVHSTVYCGTNRTCWGSTFTTSAVTCPEDNTECSNITLQNCSCCIGPTCPEMSMNCNDPQFCSTEYLGTTCQEWGNPICNVDSTINIGPTRTPTPNIVTSTSMNGSIDLSEIVQQVMWDNTALHDNDIMKYTIIKAHPLPINGEIIIVTDGEDGGGSDVVYQPNAEFSGREKFTVLACSNTNEWDCMTIVNLSILVERDRNGASGVGSGAARSSRLSHVAMLPAIDPHSTWILLSNPVLALLLATIIL